MRGVPRWFAVLAAVASALTVCAFALRQALAPAVLQLRISETHLPADGFSSTELHIRSSSGWPLPPVTVESEDPHRIVVESVTHTPRAEVAVLRAGVLPGTAKLRVSAKGLPSQEVAASTTFDATDSIGDGTPDFLRLHDAADREAFRRWFTVLAEAQFGRTGSLPTEINDCAALLRFSYREALRQHDSNWAKSLRLPVRAAASIQQYQYPFTPLGAKLFRVREGSFDAADLNNGAFAEFADAETLWRHNAYFVGREIRRARPGDLLFFRQSGHHMPFHAMIFIGSSQAGSDDSQPFVVYHTGPDGKTAGEVRRPSVAELLNYPDPRWRPVAANPVFLGVYRWNILRGDE